MIYNEPVQGLELEFKILPRETLIMSPFQRNLSSGLKNRLLPSISRGFIIPVIVVDNGDGLFEVIDGQHRLESLDVVNETKGVPAIIVPESFKFLPMILNVEKGDAIKDKCVKIDALYRWYAQNKPEYPESDLIGAVGFQPSLFSLAMGHTSDVIPSPSLVETLANKIDSTLDMNVEEGLVERVRRGGRIGEVYEEVQRIAEEVGFRDFYLKKAVVSKTTNALWGRKRNVEAEFDEGIDMVMEEMSTGNWWGLGQ